MTESKTSQGYVRSNARHHGTLFITEDFDGWREAYANVGVVDLDHFICAFDALGGCLVLLEDVIEPGVEIRSLNTDGAWVDQVILGNEQACGKHFTGLLFSVVVAYEGRSEVRRGFIAVGLDWDCEPMSLTGLPMPPDAGDFGSWGAMATGEFEWLCLMDQGFELPVE